jgi:type I restriction enzyme S subunit
MSSTSIPKGRRIVKFGDVVSNMNDSTRNPAALGLERVVGLDHMDRESLPLVWWDNLSDMHEGTSFTRVFRAGQVLFGKRRAYQRKVSAPDFDGICSGDILVFQPASSDLLPKFLPYLVQSDKFFDHALGTSAGSLSPRTKWQELAKYEFALPPLAEQQKIVDVISAFDETLECYRTLPIGIHRQSMLHELLNAEGEGWVETTLGEVAVASWGNTSVTKKQYKESGYIAFSASGPDGFVDWFEHSEPGVVISAIGALCGKTWLAGDAWTPIKNTIWFRAKVATCLTEYLFLCTSVKNYWSIRGQAQPFISLGDVRTAIVKLPPLVEQQRIVEIVSSLDRVRDSVHEAIANLLQTRNKVLNDLLTQGFKHV